MDNVEIRQAIADLRYDVRNFHADRGGKMWRWSCLVCGDSNTNRNKARFYVSIKDGSAVCHCHNCGYSAGFTHYLKDFHPRIYSQYSVDTFKKQAPTLYDINHLIDKCDSDVIVPLFYIDKYPDAKDWLNNLRLKNIRLTEKTARKAYYIHRDYHKGIHND